MSKGFVKIDRSLLTSNIWIGTGEKFTKGQAWVDLILLAEYEDNEYNGYARHRGEVHRSIRWLANRWGWSPNKVDRFLRELERNRMCDKKRTPNGTAISLAKYRVFQDTRNTKRNTNEYKSERQLRNIKNNKGTAHKKAAVPSDWGEIIYDD